MRGPEVGFGYDLVAENKKWDGFFCVYGGGVAGGAGLFGWGWGD